MNELDKGMWKDFPSGTITDGNGGDSTFLFVAITGNDEIRARLDDSLFEYL